MSSTKRGGWRCRPWTDEEVGYLEANPSLSAPEIGAELGRSASAVNQMRSRLKRGTFAFSSQNVFSEDELAVMRATPHLTVQQLADALGRSYGATKARRQQMAREEGIDFGGRGANKSPHRVGHRTIVARTCNSCELLLDGTWFWRNQYGWHGDCVRCFKQSEKPVDRDRGDGGKRLQALSLPTATRRGQEWTEADMAVLADEGLTVFEKAVKTRRTYFGAMTATTRYGFKSKVGRGDPEKGRWVIDNPNETTTATAA